MKYIAAVIYLLSVAMVAAFPFTAAGLQDMTDTYVVSFRLDHLLHMLAFVPLYPLAWWLLLPRKVSVKALLLAGCILLAATAEGVQFFLNYRSFNPADLMSNAGGVVIGWLLMQVIEMHNAWQSKENL